MPHECTEKLFLRDVATHEMIVIRDDQNGRHIRFKRPDTSSYYFDFITWPGHLCYTGDMGTYVFQRLTDMFEFFRTDREYNRQRGRELSINLSYWTEKLIAVDGGRSGGEVREFSEEKFRRVINEYRVQWMRSAKENASLDKEGRRELWEAVDNEVLSIIDDEGGDRAQHAAHDFCHNPESSNRSIGRRRDGYQFDDLFEHDFTDYKFHIVWCCYALAWGIQKYDDAKAAAVAGAPSVELSIEG